MRRMIKIRLLSGYRTHTERHLEVITAYDPHQKLWVTGIFPDGKRKPLVSVEWGDETAATEGHQNIQKVLRAVSAWLVFALLEEE